MSTLLAVGLALFIQSPSATLKFDTPEGWISKPPTSKMRLAEFVLPRADGDPEDAILVSDAEHAIRDVNEP